MLVVQLLSIVKQTVQYFENASLQHIILYHFSHTFNVFCIVNEFNLV